MRITPKKQAALRELVRLRAQIKKTLLDNFNDSERLAVAELVERAGAAGVFGALVRYCPECGYVGDVHAGWISCCPDGGRAIRTSLRVAILCRGLLREAEEVAA